MLNFHFGNITIKVCGGKARLCVSVPVSACIAFRLRFGIFRFRNTTVNLSRAGWGYALAAQPVQSGVPRAVSPAPVRIFSSEHQKRGD